MTDFTPSVDRIVDANRAYADESFDSSLAAAPAIGLAVVVCMDARIDPYGALGLSNGDAHVIRNGGGIVTDDVIRSLCLSQRALGTREIVLVHHTRCGLHQTDEASFRAELLADVGVTPPWSLESFADPHDDVRQSARRLRASPFIQHTDHMSGFVYDVDDGLLHPVALD